MASPMAKWPLHGFRKENCAVAIFFLFQAEHIYLFAKLRKCQSTFARLIEVFMNRVNKNPISGQQL
jgi:hypothetical protein